MFLKQKRPEMDFERKKTLVVKKNTSIFRENIRRNVQVFNGYPTKNFIIFFHILLFQNILFFYLRKKPSSFNGGGGSPPARVR